MEIDLEKFKKHKDKEVVAIVELLQTYTESPLADAYVSIYKQLQKWAAELEKNPSTLEYSPDNGDDDQKYFDKVHKYITTVDAMYDKLAVLRAKMTNEQEKQVDKKIQKSTTIPI